MGPGRVLWLGFAQMTGGALGSDFSFKLCLSSLLDPGWVPDTQTHRLLFILSARSGALGATPPWGQLQGVLKKEPPFSIEFVCGRSSRVCRN